MEKRNNFSRSLPPKFIECGDVQFRVLETNDIAALKQAKHESYDQLKKFMFWVHKPLRDENLVKRIIEVKADYLFGKSFEFGIIDIKTGKLLGCCSLMPVERSNPKCLEIGYWIRTSEVGKGLATLAAQMMTVLGFEVFDCDRIQITANIENKASLRVIDKCGFCFEGYMRNGYDKPSQEMITNGFTKERTISLSALIDKDKKELSWYPSILKQIKFK